MCKKTKEKNYSYYHSYRKTTTRSINNDGNNVDKSVFPPKGSSVQTIKNSGGSPTNVNQSIVNGNGGSPTNINQSIINSTGDSPINVNQSIVNGQNALPAKSSQGNELLAAAPSQMIIKLLKQIVSILQGKKSSPAQDAPTSKQPLSSTPTNAQPTNSPLDFNKAASGVEFDPKTGLKTMIN